MFSLKNLSKSKGKIFYNNNVISYKDLIKISEKISNNIKNERISPR